eukprot:scaffold1419_cov410-Prasinococcus_capsulatus_cf.AAC.27
MGPLHIGEPSPDGPLSRQQQQCSERRPPATHFVRGCRHKMLRRPPPSARKPAVAALPKGRSPGSALASAASPRQIDRSMTMVACAPSSTYPYMYPSSRPCLPRRSPQLASGDATGRWSRVDRPRGWGPLGSSRAPSTTVAPLRVGLQGAGGALRLTAGLMKIVLLYSLHNPIGYYYWYIHTHTHIWRPGALAASSASKRINREG